MKNISFDGGICTNGLESTILYQDMSTQINPWKIIRQGALTPDDFEDVLGYYPEIITPESDKKIICPGQLYRHNAPKAKLQLTKEIPKNYLGVIIGFDDVIYPEGCKVYSLGS